MSLIFLDQGESVGLQLLTNKIATPRDLILNLFQNDVTDGLTAEQIEALDESDFTPADFTGYSAITLTGASWTPTEGDPTSIAYAQQTFESSEAQEAQTIYGYYLTQVSTGLAIAFEEFASPATIENDGDQIKITPVITGRDEQDS